MNYIHTSVYQNNDHSSLKMFQMNENLDLQGMIRTRATQQTHVYTICQTHSTTNEAHI